MTIYRDLSAEAALALGQGLVAGVDEVGRGPLVGNVVTAAVILDPQRPIAGLNDSKKLSEKKRDALFDLIMDNALCVAVGSATPVEIDQLNILHATMLAMQRAVAGLTMRPERVLVDGNRTPDFGIPAAAVIKGDGLIAAISAASIIAKVTRDREMAELDRCFPQYGFAAHKGYPTKAHFEAIAQYGVLSEHRRSFRPVRLALGLE
ncbi:MULTISPECIES: ribonuclease HII [unclassified Shewanella]|jgi:ribonuclease HII|uniref:ribonuclease HII n=1 Tax=unclassified Shewanella TaxID=196818 RepID=UPI001A9945B8|nr:ribonuclease HII [Shewanella sp. 4t3-1-2LB]MBO1270423.1 ribonuclease HII [Shewanella sp. 4t3-1-2LB]